MQIARITNDDLPLVIGMDNTQVYTLHLMLNNVASRYDNFTPLPLQSLFDENTQREVKRWQRVISHTESGEVDKVTWNNLAEFYLLPTTVT